MNKRQLIAACALQALLAHASPGYNRASLAKEATEFADAVVVVTGSGADPITAREEIAAQALQALILKDPFQQSSQRAIIAREAVDLADAVIALT